MSSSLIGLAADTAPIVGHAGFEAELTDSETHERLGAAADERVGTKTLSGATDSWSDVNDALQYWANLSAYRICTAKRLTTCQKPQVKRGL